MASLVAAMLNVSILMPSIIKGERNSKGGHMKKVRQHEDNDLVGMPSSSRQSNRRKRHKRDFQDGTNTKKITPKAFVHKVKDKKTSKISPASLVGFAKDRTSAVVIGAPPSLSSNVETPFITSVIHGDDIVCRATRDSLDELRKRTIRVLKKNTLTKRVGWMTDTIALAVSC